ncbi:hypothetical protein LTR08_005074 [Meristemomyces frigidus]|nr:hypothetical protein LTR08_005074 [Meristemomyces frigidus]
MANIEHGLPVYDEKAAMAADEKNVGQGTDGQKGRRSSVVTGEVISGELYDERFETTKRGLKSRHAQMIALGGTIGTALARGGPAFILGCYMFMALLVWCVVTGITEVAAWLPTRGYSMNLFGYRYVSRSLGFAMGWLYWYSLGILVPYEITAAGLVIEYWNTPVNIAVWITIMAILIVALNALPVRFYGETEFWFASLKVFMMVGLLLLSFILFWGGGPSRDRLGFRFWKHPGAANTYLEEGNTGRFCALLSTLVLSAFPFTFAPELCESLIVNKLLVCTGGEMESPRRNLPTAAKRYFYRLIVFYIGCVLAIGILCPSNDLKLTDGGAGTGSSTFVIGIKNAGISGLDSVINGGIIISAWSSGNSFLYLSSRSLYSLSMTGNAPAFFKACTKGGVPYRAVAASSLFIALAYLNVASSGTVVFDWFVNLTNTSGFISWICCSIVVLRFRKACKAQGITSDMLPYHNKWFQPWGSYAAIVGFMFLTLINGFSVFWPENWSASGFLTAYVGIPIFLAIYFCHRVYARHDPWAHDPAEVDLRTGMEEVEAEETAPPVYKKWYRVVFE